MTIAPQGRGVRVVPDRARAICPSRSRRRSRIHREVPLQPDLLAINYEALHGMRDPKVRTVRTDLGLPSGRCPSGNGSLYMLVWCRQPRRSDGMGAEQDLRHQRDDGRESQVVDMQFVAQTLDVAPAPARPTGLFLALSDKELARTGLPDVLVPAIRAIQREDELEKLQPYLPQEAFEALYLVAAGTDLDTAIRESSRPPIAEPTKPVDTTDFAAALQKPASRRQFRLIENEDELEEMLDASIDKWRVFLHPTQDAIVRANSAAPPVSSAEPRPARRSSAMHRAASPREAILEGSPVMPQPQPGDQHRGLSDSLCGKAERTVEVANSTAGQ